MNKLEICKNINYNTKNKKYESNYFYVKNNKAIILKNIIHIDESEIKYIYHSIDNVFKSTEKNSNKPIYKNETITINKNNIKNIVANHDVKLYDFNIETIIALCNPYKNKKIISVGSGIGELEYFLSTKDFKITCIDPSPFSFSKINHGRYKLPEYKYLKDYINSNKNCIGNDNLMLIWPDPNLNYDIDSVLTLKSPQIFIIYELSNTNSASGSDSFIKWKKEQSNYVLVSQLLITRYITHNQITERLNICFEIYDSEWKNK